MKKLSILVLFLIGVLVPAQRAGADSGESELILFDAPRGAWRATVRTVSSWEVVEVRDGWTRVRLEGWIAGPLAVGAAASNPGSGPDGRNSTGAATPSGETPSPGPGAGGLPPPENGTTVSGVLMPTHSEQSSSPGAGLVVLLIDDLAAVDRDHDLAGRECRADLDASMRRIDELTALLDRQFNSSDNFREATARHDRARADVRDAEAEHRETVERCRRSADEVFQEHTIQRVISDLAGRFQFVGVTRGRYRVVASEIGGENPRSWSLDCVVEGPIPVVLDPRTDRSKIEPYWGLNRGSAPGKESS